MSECCTPEKSKNSPAKRYSCPLNNKEYLQVSIKTILHHLKEPWRFELIDQAYYFCDDPLCDVVYFGQDDSVIDRGQLRTPVGIKEPSEDALICYCFGVTKRQASSNDKIKSFVIEQTKAGSCSCETHNPSGRCCLKDFP